jgi:DNA-binding GntR family transcriptional regulator
VTGDDTAPFPPDEFEYLVVAGRLAARIRRGEFSDGRFPGRPEVARHYGVGSGVVRHAWDELKQRGLIYVVQGHGTFVA